MERYFIDLSFDGTSFSGWQRQKNAISVQQILEEKLSLKLKTDVELVGCGRTDAGVHARQFVAHFDTDVIFDKDELMYSLNRFLPQTIAINRIYEVVADAHARYSAIERTYKYYIHRRKNPFLLLYSMPYFSPLDVGLMNEAAQYLLAVEDFTSFTRLHGGSTHARCKLFRCYWEQNDDMLVFTISANRFTRNMVRAIVGTMLELGRAKINLHDFKHIVENKNRNMAGESVEARGLFLEQVMYPENICKISSDAR